MTYGSNLGNGLGAEQQAFAEKTLLENIVQNTIYEKYATITKGLPLKNSKEVQFNKWITFKESIFANNINADLTGNTPSNGEESLQLVDANTYSSFVLAEGSSGTAQGSMKMIRPTANVFPIGMFTQFTEEMDLFHDFWTVGETARQMGETAGLIIDGFYRDMMTAGAGHSIDITGNAAPANNVTNSSFTSALRKIHLQLQLSGAKPVNRILSASVKYGTIPVKAEYTMIVHPLVAERLRENADFVPIEKYGTDSGMLDNEVGKISYFRVVENANALIDNHKSGTYDATCLVFGKDHTAQVALRGKNKVEFITKALGSSGTADALNRVGTVGFKTWLGSKVLYPERLGVIKAKVTTL